MAETRVFLSIVGAVAGSSFGSQCWVTVTGAWSAAEYVPFAVTSTFEVCVRSSAPSTR